MAIEGWKLFAALTVGVAVYALGVAVLDTTPSLGGFLIVVVFGGAGLLMGNYLSDRLK